MSSLDDLGGALRDDAAANAPRASAIDVDAVARAARTRRRPRQWAVGTLSVAAVLGFGGIAVAAITPPTMIAAIDSADFESGVTGAESAPLAEGGGALEDAPDSNEARVGELLACAADTSQLSSTNVSLDLVTTPLATAGVAGEPITTTAQLTNTTGSAVSFTMSAEAAGALATDGVVVGTGTALDAERVEVRLAAGETATVPVRLETTDCRDLGAAPLVSGAYTAIVVLELVDEANGAVERVVAPAIEIRLD